MLFRTPAQKADLAWSWQRGDRAFFAAGACHVLAHEFLLTPAGRGFRPIMVQPAPGFRGGHVFASDGILVFDYHGFSRHAVYVAHYLRKIQRFFPGWRGSIVDITDSFWTDAWFDQTNHRRPHQFHRDPTDRARHFIAHTRLSPLGLPPPRPALS